MASMNLITHLSNPPINQILKLIVAIVALHNSLRVYFERFLASVLNFFKLFPALAVVFICLMIYNRVQQVVSCTKVSLPEQSTSSDLSGQSPTPSQSQSRLIHLLLERHSK